MVSDADRFDLALARFDAANSEDPTPVVVHGQPLPAELAYGRWMTAWMHRLYPDASEELQLAARCQHIRRWQVPRDSYPMDRAGYHRWRTDLYSFHADQAGTILREVGYPDESIARVRSLLRKERLKADAETQALEDVICLVFLEHIFADFALKHEEEKIVTILRRTWAKMSPRGHEAALALPLPQHLQALVAKALANR